MAGTKTVKVGVNVSLLREQRDAVLRELDSLSHLSGQDGIGEHINLLDGLVNMLDSMLDIAEGHDGPQSR